MIEHFAIYDQITGLIIQTGTGAAGISADQVGLIPNTGVVVGEAYRETDYVKLDGVMPEIRPRPFVPAMYPATGTAPLTLEMSGFHAGFVVTATNEAGESVTTDDPDDPIILMDPETYTVQIDPPWPYLPETLTIEVT